MRAAINAVKLHPTWVAYLASLLVGVAARYGVDVDGEVAAGAAFALLTVGLAVAHRYTTPLVRPRDAEGRALVPSPPFAAPTRYRRSGPGSGYGVDVETTPPPPPYNRGS